MGLEKSFTASLEYVWGGGCQAARGELWKESVGGVNWFAWGLFWCVFEGEGGGGSDDLVEGP